jgi:putative chitinase
MELTLQQLKQMVHGIPHAENWLEALDQLLPDYEINTPKRVAAFIAQCAHESGGFRFIKENLNYKAESLRKVFPKYFPTDELARAYAKKPEMIANRVYASHAWATATNSLAMAIATAVVDLIQLTGKSNYENFAASLEISPEEAAEYLGTFEGAAQSQPAGSGKATT